MIFIFRSLWRILIKPRAGPPQGQAPALSSIDVVRVEKTKALDESTVLGQMNTLPAAKVIHVVDGDTVIVSQGGKQTTVRLDSIDCPENDQPWGYTAHAGLIRLIGGRSVRMEVHGHDDYGRTLATLYVSVLGGDEWLNVNERMLLLGHAWVMRFHFDHLPVSRQQKLFRLLNWARSRKVGLWNTPDPIPPWKWKSMKRAAVLEKYKPS